MGQARRYYALQGGWVVQKRPILALRNYAMAPYGLCIYVHASSVVWRRVGKYCLSSVMTSIVGFVGTQYVIQICVEPPSVVFFVNSFFSSPLSALTIFCTISQAPFSLLH